MSAASRAPGDDEPPSGAALDWRIVARRWERWRLGYNALVFLAGAVWFIFDPWMLIFAPLIILYALAANVCYLFGPITELYCRWVGDWLDERRLPFAAFLLSGWLFYILWIGGTFFSVAMTFVLGAESAMSNKPMGAPS